MNDDFPAGWGSILKRMDETGEPPKPATKGPGECGKFYEFPAGMFPDVDSDAIGRQVYRNTVAEEIQLYEESHDDLHLWRAWRTARVAGDIPADVFAALAPVIDKFTEWAIGPSLRAEERTRRLYMMRDYYYLKAVMEEPNGRAKLKSEAEIFRRLAKHFKTTAGAIKQVVLEQTGRGQRGKNHRSRGK